MNQQQLQQFFTERPAISKRAIAREADIAPRTLDYAISDGRITEETAQKLKPVMQKYGWALNKPKE